MAICLLLFTNVSWILNAKMCQFYLLQVSLWQQYGGTAGGGVIDNVHSPIFDLWNFLFVGEAFGLDCKGPPYEILEFPTNFIFFSER